MTPDELLQAALAVGLRLRVVDGLLVASGVRRTAVPRKLLSELQANRVALMQELVRRGE